MYKAVYSTSVGSDALNEFIKPELKDADKYYRSTGHFSSSFLVSAAEIFADFFKNGKQMKVLCCVELTEDDYNAISEGTSAESIVECKIIDELDDLPSLIEFMRDQPLNFLKKIISEGFLEIRIVVPPKGGLYHQKYGLIYGRNHKIGFTGGFNLSLQAHEINSESCSPFYEDTGFYDYEEIFQIVWNNESKTDRTYEFPDACKKVILRKVSDEIMKRSSNPEVVEKEKKSLRETLWNHQDKAFDSFFNNGCTGVIQMATGTGKTRLAMAIAEELYSKSQISVVVIVAGRTPLLDQWRIQIEDYFTDFGSICRFGKENTMKYLKPYLDLEKPVFIFTSYQLLKEIIPNLAGYEKKSLIVCDEVHNLGAEGNIQTLEGITEFTYKLGLSATPERMYDEVGTNFIFEAIGPILFTYSLKNAIDDGILCKFDYIPLKYELTEIEREKISRYYKMQFGKDAEKTLSVAEVRRLISNVYKQSAMKYEPFKDFISRNPNILNRCVIFVSDKKYGEGVQDILNSLFPYLSYHTFYDDDPDEYLCKFSSKKLDCLLTCNKISEGIDITDISAIVLFSASRSDTETLQRIGRCLRKDKNNPDKKAKIIDFVVESNLKKEGSADFDRYQMLCELCDVVIE